MTGRHGPSAHRVVLIHRYYEPDTPPYAEMLSNIARALANDGFEVEVLTAQPSYGDSSLHDRAPSLETKEGVRIVRLPLLNERKDQTARRVFNLGLFSAQVFLRVVRGARPDVVMAATTPPIAVAAIAGLAATCRRASFVYHNQDIYPEVLGPQAHGLKARVLKVLRRLDARTGRRAARVVVLSSDMADAWAERGVSEASIATINNFDTVEPHGNSAAAIPHSPNGRRIVFAGNVGKFQDVPNLVEAVEEVALPGVELVIVGDGADLERAQSVAGPATTFCGRVSASDAASWVASSQLAVVTLAPGLIRYVYPSKTFGYLAAGVPILARVELNSELARSLTDSRAGIAVDPRDRAGLRSAIERFAEMSDEELVNMGENAREMSARHQKAVVLKRWVALFHELVGARRV